MEVIVVWSNIGALSWSLLRIVRSVEVPVVATIVEVVASLSVGRLTLVLQEIEWKTLEKHQELSDSESLGRLSIVMPLVLVKLSSISLFLDMSLPHSLGLKWIHKDCGSLERRVLCFKLSLLSSLNAGETHKAIARC